MDWLCLVDYMTEDELCDAAGITHREYRKHVAEPTEKLPDGAVLEIYNLKSRDKTLLAKKYKTSESQVRRAFQLHCSIYTVYPPKVLRRRIEELLPASDSYIAARLNISKNMVKTTLGIVPTSREKLDTDEINRLLDKGLSQQEIAFELNVAPSTISYHSKNKPKKPRRPETIKWAEILDRAAAGENKSALAREYGVARTTIIHKLKSR